MNYTLGSLFDGSGGFPLAGALCGITPLWASEVEPYPIAVTKSRFPKMKHLGDISKINGADIEPVDIITFGSPCQDLSIAGKRAGLKHEENGDEETTRSGLFMEAVRIIKEMRAATNGKYPRFALWENVPGAFSSNKGEDFRTVCEELIKIVEPKAVMPEVPKNGWAYADSYIGDGWSLAYRVFDAQYWGVPQRRRRIHLIADFRGECAREILFEREGVRGYFETGRTPWQAITTNVERCSGADDQNADCVALNPVSATLRAGAGAPKHESDFIGRLVLQPAKNLILDDQGGQQITVRTDGKVPTLRAETHGNLPCILDSTHIFAVENHPADSRVNIDANGKVQTLTSRMGTGGGNVPMVMVEPAYTLKIRSGCEGGGKGALVQEDKSATLATNNDQYLFQPIVCMATQQGGAEIRTDDKAPTITAAAGMSGNNQPVIACAGFKPNQGSTAGGIGFEDEISPTLLAGQEPGCVYCLQGNGIDRADTAGCNGKGWKEDTSYTLNTVDRPAVAYSFDSLASNSMKSKNPNSGCREVNVAKTLDTSNPDPSKNQGGIAIVHSTNDLYEWHNQDNRITGPIDVACTLNTNAGGREGHLVLSDMTETFPQQAYDQFIHDKIGATLKAGGGTYGGGSETLVTETRPRYIVRRLTPTECARLQGFADYWGIIEPKTEFSDAEYKFWIDVRNTHAAINGRAVKEYTEKQMLSWYNKLHTDSAEYKMWGNGIALPPALYCMQGIVDALTKKV